MKYLKLRKLYRVSEAAHNMSHEQLGTVFAIEGAAFFAHELRLKSGDPVPNRILVYSHMGHDAGLSVLTKRKGRYGIHYAETPEETHSQERGMVGVIAGHWREPDEITVGPYRIEAQQDKDGFLRLTVGGLSGQTVIPVNHPWSGLCDGSEQLVFTDNRTIIAYELDFGGDVATPSGRTNPKPLRKAGKDPGFRALWKLNHAGREAYARDPATYADYLERADVDDAARARVKR